MSKIMSCDFINEMENKLSDDNLLNMVAAVNIDSITERLLPNVFCRGDDIEKFIKRCELYFDAKGISQIKQQEILISCLLDEDLLEEYAKTLKKTEGFQNHLCPKIMKLVIVSHDKILEMLYNNLIWGREYSKRENILTFCDHSLYSDIQLIDPSKKKYMVIDVKCPFDSNLSFEKADCSNRVKCQEIVQYL